MELTATQPDDRTPEAAATRSGLGRTRRIAVVAVIVSLSITAVVGIVSLLTGEFGELQSRVLGTTSLVGAFSVLALCHLAVAGRPVRVVGFAGLALSAVALLFGLLLIWGDGFDWQAFEWFAVFAVFAVSLAHANLLLLLAGRRQVAVRTMLVITLAAIACVALGIVMPLITDGRFPGDDFESYWRLFGVIAIVDVLGTIVLPVVAAVLRPGERRTADAARADDLGHPAPDSPPAPRLALPLELEHRVRAEAVSRGVEPERLLAELVATHLPG